jgi:hypothetical protein
MYDLIGDIHGHADELVQLLRLLGYQQSRGVYRHPDRKVIYLGDFIDRGPQIREVLAIVWPMIAEGTALAVMGNHELNAIAFHTEDPKRPGTHLRTRSNKNIRQHSKTISALTDEELVAAIDWFRTLPMRLDLDEGLRVVHACWDERALASIAAGLTEHRGVTTAFLEAACKKGAPLFAPVDITLKGKEAKLPEGYSFVDPQGHVRTDIRTRWYLPPDGHAYGTYALQSDEIVCPVPLEQAVIDAAAPYPADAKPVFVGHYWLTAPRPELLAENVACLDYSVAKGGFLCAYRWDGEQKLTNERFVWVPAAS